MVSIVTVMLVLPATSAAVVSDVKCGTVLSGIFNGMCKLTRIRPSWCPTHHDRYHLQCVVRHFPSAILSCQQNCHGLEQSMSLFKFITQIFSVVIGLLNALLYSGTSILIANLKDLSANAKTYEEWHLCQEELDALSQRNIWSVTHPVCSSQVDSRAGAQSTKVRTMIGSTYAIRWEKLVDFEPTKTSSHYVACCGRIRCATYAESCRPPCTAPLEQVPNT